MSYLGGLLSILQQVMWWRESDSRLVCIPQWRPLTVTDTTSCSMSISFPGPLTKGQFEVDNPQANNIVEAMLRHPDLIRPLPDGSFKYSFDPVGTKGYTTAPSFSISVGVSAADYRGCRTSVYLLNHHPNPKGDPWADDNVERVPADYSLVEKLNNMVAEITYKTKKTREETSLSRLYLAVVDQHPLSD